MDPIWPSVVKYVAAVLVAAFFTLLALAILVGFVT